MPLYLYRNEQTGEEVEEFRKVAERDKRGWRRLMPSRILVHMHGRKEPAPINMVASVEQGFRQCEEVHGVEKIERDTGYTVKEIKRIWNNFKQNDQRPIPE
jgi:hypothetical protein